MTENQLDRIVMCVVLILLIIAVFSLAGCAQNVLRVTEYQGDGSYLGQVQGAAKGVQVSRDNDVQGCLVFEGDHSTYRSEGCDASE